MRRGAPNGLRLAAPALLLAAACAAPPSTIDADAAGGFAIYRSGRMGEAALAELCREGVREIVVLDGSARRQECRFRARACPDGLAVRYDVEQSPHLPLSGPFLGAFDLWVRESRAAGRKIAIRCRHGWHRAGRLAAWYRMRHQGWGGPDALDEMLRAGRFMWRHPQLEPQVEALADVVAGRPCSASRLNCVSASPNLPDEPELSGGFPADVCPGAEP